MGGIVAIVNPVAGRGRAGRAWPAYEAALRSRGIDLEVLYTAGPGDARDMARRARERHADLVLVTGGDGTVHEAVNGMGPGGPALAVVPLGTGNDLARGLRVTATPAAVADLVVRGRRRRLDLGYLETADGGRFFVNVSGVGLDAEVARRVYEEGGPGRGALPYVLSMLRTLRQYRNVPMEIRIDGHTHHHVALMTVVGNSPYYGGGMHILPGATPDDGRFDVLLIGDLGKLETLWVFPKVFRGTHVRHRRVTSLRGSAVEIRSPEPVAVHADGEPAGYLPVRYRNYPGGMLVLVPPADARAAAASVSPADEPVGAKGAAGAAGVATGSTAAGPAVVPPGRISAAAEGDSRDPS
ncbi:diacylglycerol kinase catalytic region [Thermaerobacter marianensis DSM 12885]|uniref:Diacylglycerol kinase catalytic region n=1 Tax=Thermaerobacter marianensis (strain ATCC 700841 / DSM 12885 / JCM 10246 / 7p75a) TaxID=644966 RepID=E6SLY3_THEM7|nr:diacylglycerol kinase family protein [Thermaerobacter marianensis]ADU52441.1 diacylglycerol kinase catalytic region [Thermaerobacter marianensis DSM 12885]